MGVLVRNHGAAWWVFMNYCGNRKAMKVGEKKTAGRVAGGKEG